MMAWIAGLSVFILVTGVGSLISLWVFGLGKGFELASGLFIILGAFLGVQMRKWAKEFNGP